MIRIIILVFFVSVGISQVPPPVWPQEFTQSFVESYETTHLHITGRLHYSAKKDLERIDRSDGQHEILCGSVLPNVPSPCTQLVREKRRYIIYPERRMCCYCCDEAHGCGVTKPDWLSKGVYEGEETIYGEAFYKWSLQFGNVKDYYYATQSDQRIPRRLNETTGNRDVDFIMNTYSTQPIADQVFALPSYCISACPATTICGKLQSMPVKQDVVEA